MIIFYRVRLKPYAASTGTVRLYNSTARLYVRPADINPQYRIRPHAAVDLQNIIQKFATHNGIGNVIRSQTTKVKAQIRKRGGPSGGHAHISRTFSSLTF